MASEVVETILTCGGRILKSVLRLGSLQNDLNLNTWVVSLLAYVSPTMQFIYVICQYLYYEDFYLSIYCDL